MTSRFGSCSSVRVKLSTKHLQEIWVSFLEHIKMICTSPCGGTTVTTSLARDKAPINSTYRYILSVNLIWFVLVLFFLFFYSYYFILLCFFRSFTPCEQCVTYRQSCDWRHADGWVTVKIIEIRLKPIVSSSMLTTTEYTITTKKYEISILRTLANELQLLTIKLRINT